MGRNKANTQSGEERLFKPGRINDRNLFLLVGAQIFKYSPSTQTHCDRFTGDETKKRYGFLKWKISNSQNMTMH